jgi:CHAT domain-containing protein
MSWVVTSRAISVHALEGGRSDLEAEASAFEAAINSGRDEEARVTGADLYRLLFSPQEKALSRSETLIIVPDGACNSMAFAALWNATRAQYVGETWAIVTAASAFLVIEPYTPPPAPCKDVVVVADPHVSGMKPLPGAVRESGRVAAQFQTALVLAYGDATVRRALRPRRCMSSFHYAGHAEFNERMPSASRLLFAGERQASGVLSVRDIQRGALGRHRMFVMAACASARKASKHFDGSSSIAEAAFCARVAPVVVGSVLPVNDAETGFFFESFYRAVLSGADSATALKMARQASIKDGRNVRVWSGFTVVGLSG